MSEKWFLKLSLPSPVCQGGKKGIESLGVPVRFPHTFLILVAPPRAETFPLVSRYIHMIIVHIVKGFQSLYVISGNYEIFYHHHLCDISLTFPVIPIFTGPLYPLYVVLHRNYKRKVPQQGTCVMHQPLQKPDVCQPFKTTRDCDKRRLSCLSPQRRAGLKRHKQRQWWDRNRRVGASSSGVSTMLSPTAHADTDTHKHTFMYIERGPARTASQEKEEWGGGNHNGTVWGVQWIFFCLIQQTWTHIRTHTHCCTYDPNKDRHTRSSVELLEEEPWSPFVHATSSSRMAFFLSSAHYLSVFSPHQRCQPFY